MISTETRALLAALCMIGCQSPKACRCILAAMVSLVGDCSDTAVNLCEQSAH